MGYPTDASLTELTVIDSQARFWTVGVSEIHLFSILFLIPPFSISRLQSTPVLMSLHSPSTPLQGNGLARTSVSSEAESPFGAGGFGAAEEGAAFELIPHLEDCGMRALSCARPVERQRQCDDCNDGRGQAAFALNTPSVCDRLLQKPVSERCAPRSNGIFEVTLPESMSVLSPCQWSWEAKHHRKLCRRVR